MVSIKQTYMRWGFFSKNFKNFQCLKMSWKLFTKGVSTSKFQFIPYDAIFSFLGSGGRSFVLFFSSLVFCVCRAALLLSNYTKFFLKAISLEVFSVSTDYARPQLSSNFVFPTFFSWNILSGGRRVRLLNRTWLFAVPQSAMPWRGGIGSITACLWFFFDVALHRIFSSASERVSVRFCLFVVIGFFLISRLNSLLNIGVVWTARRFC